MSRQPLTRLQIITLCALVCLASTSIDINIPAIPAIADAFAIPQGSGHLLISSYLVGFAVGQIPIGLMSDRYGRLPVLHLGLGVYIVATWMASQAGQFDTLLWARFIQGLAGAAGGVLARAIVRDSSDGIQLAKLSAMLVTSLAVATLIAPLIGSWILSFGDWDDIFYANIIFAVVLVIAFALLFKETNTSEQRQLHRQQNIAKQFKHSLTKFVTTEQCLWSASLVAIAFFGYMAIVAGLASVVMEVYGLSEQVVGWSFAAAAFFYILSSTFNRIKVALYGPWRLLHWGAFSTLVGLPIIAAAMLHQQAEFWLVWLALVPFLAALGLVLANGTAVALQPMGKTAGFAAAMLGSAQIGFGALGSYVGAVLYDGTSNAMLTVIGLASVLLLLTYFLGYRLFKPAE